MRKPTAIQFFGVEGAIWLLLIGYLIATHDGGPPSIMLKISAVNICIAGFNMLGFCVSMLTGWYPWRET